MFRVPCGFFGTQGPFVEGSGFELSLQQALCILTLTWGWHEFHRGL